MNTQELKAHIQAGGLDTLLGELYGSESLSAARTRVLGVIEGFVSCYGNREQVCLCSVPGRSEIAGNHTDHNMGRVMAASIDLDILAVASATDDGVIALTGKGFPEDRVAIDRRGETKALPYSSAALIGGVCDGLIRNGYPVTGFVAYTESNVFKGSGLSSSAAFEVMVGNLLRTLCHSRVSNPELAMIARYAENEFFGKPCGLMDQMACAVGGFIAIDFEDPQAPAVTAPDFDLSALGYSLCIVNTGGNHADLNEDYASVPAEMKQVAEFLGVPALRYTTKEAVMADLSAIRAACGDRALLRALHFFRENARVEQASAALERGDIAAFFENIRESGRSSFCYLQNVYTVKNIKEQGLSLALCLSEDYLSGVKRPSACRVHGGGFAGTIQAFVPKEDADGYRRAMDAVFGEGACHVLSIRRKGAIALVS